MDKPVGAEKRAALLSVLFPKICLCCDRLVRCEEVVCPLCAAHLEYVDSKHRCLHCGLDKKYCQCRVYAYHFVSVIAPFYNIGLARRAFYRYKFSLRKKDAAFFADAMAHAVQTEYANISFTGVAYVPTSARHIAGRGFDQAELLARLVAERLNLPLLPDALIHQAVIGKTQHRLDRTQRFAAVRKSYRCGMPLSGNLLLVDDIKTTGATLDECARQLLLAGADAVYAVTALIRAMQMQVTDDYVLAICGKETAFQKKQRGLK